MHSGENDSGGHDAVYINPHGDGNWFKFHDDIVYPVSKEEAVDNNFGNSQCPSAGRRANAYMLSYIRSSSLDEILCEVTQDDIPECLKVKFSEERRIEAQRKKESNEAHLYMDVQVLTEDSFSKWSGHDLFNTKNVKPVNFKIRKNETLENATKIIAESFGYEAMQCHLWPMRKRGNGTVRPFGAGIRTEAACSSKTPDELSFFSLNGEQDSVVIVFLEVCESEECELDLFPNFDKINHKMVHFKYYNPSAKILSYCGHAYVDPKSPPSALSPMLCERAGLSEATPLLFYKEVDWKLTEKMSCEERLEVMELRDGDIICFQVDESLSEFECPTPVEYLKYMSEQVDIHFYDRTHDPKDYKYENYFVDTLYLEMPFIEMVDYIAGKVLNVARNRIRFFKPQVQLKCPGEMIKSTYGGRLKDIVCAGATTLYFRLLNESDDIPEEESEFKCTFINAEFMVEYPLAFEIRKKEVTVQDIFNEAMVKIKTYFRDSEKLRLIELSSCKIQRIVAPAENLDAFIQHSQSQYRIEEIPNEEVDIDEERAMLLPAMHFQKIPSTTFGRPFYIKLHEGEAISSMKARVRHKLRLSELQFKKIKFARVCMGKVTYLRDVPSIKLVDFKNLLGQPQMLGLDYIAPRSTHTHDDNEKTLRSVPRTIKLRRQIIVQFEVGHQAVCRRHPTPFGHTHDWSVFVRGAAGSDMSHFVDKVLFTLHESFPNHHRVRRIHPYRLHETGYGSFKLGVELFFHTDKHPSRYQFDYELNLQLVGMPPYKFSRLIHLPFLAPCEDFERKLLHGGGKIVLPLS